MGSHLSRFRKLNKYATLLTSVPKQSIQDKDLFKPHDVWFAPNNHLVAVSDIGDKSVKIFTLEGDQEQVNRFVIGYNVTRNLIVQDVNAIKKE